MAAAESEGIMMSRQNELRRFPVAPLRETLHKYLEFLQPLLTSEAIKASEEIVNEFIKPNGEGEKLYKLLERRASFKDNWVSDWWMEEMFLKPRVPLPWYSSPILVFPRQTFSTKEQQLRHAALLVAGALDMKYQIDRQFLQPEATRNGPLDMSQYPKLFYAYQVPCRGGDRLELCSVTDVLSKNVVAIHNNQFFAFSGHDAGGTPYDERRILQQLLRVVDMSPENGVPVGILTAQNRDVWAESYKRLCQSLKNAACVETIQKAALVVCLDRAVDASGPYEESCGSMFVGGAKGENEGNRWYDKTLQFIVGREGHAGIMFVHSPIDSSLVASLLDHCYDYMKNREHFDPTGVVMDETPWRLQFKLSSEMMQEIDNAKHFHARLREDMDQVIYKFPDYGKDFIKSLGMSPDSYVQMALQLAYYKMNKAPGMLHESVYLRHFLYGRTEGVRGSSTESLSFCKVFESPSASMEEKEISLRRAVTKHKRDVALAINGIGMDRLLFGLKMVAMENGIPLPALFKDPAFDLSGRFRIKTAQVSARCDGVMIDGPAFPDGYFVLYNMRSDSINFGVSSFRSCPTTSAEEFRSALKESLTQMRDCVLHSVAQLGI